MTEIQARLFEMRDENYGNFQGNLIPTIEMSTVIGVRTPALRKYAKQLIKEDKAKEFMTQLSHSYFEENQLHAFIISEIKDFDSCIKEVEIFLPYIDNWATCDQLTPKVFKKEADKLLPYIEKWITSSHTYTVRFAMKMLMDHFLDGRYDIRLSKLVEQVRSEEYYINMMIAWYFATALAKQYDSTIPVLQGKRLDKWVHNKTIQKAVESYRITDEQKDYLRTLRIK